MCKALQNGGRQLSCVASLCTILEHSLRPWSMARICYLARETVCRGRSLQSVFGWTYLHLLRHGAPVYSFGTVWSSEFGCAWNLDLPLPGPVTWGTFVNDFLILGCPTCEAGRLCSLGSLYLGPSCALARCCGLTALLFNAFLLQFFQRQWSNEVQVLSLARCEDKLRDDFKERC